MLPTELSIPGWAPCLVEALAAGHPVSDVRFDAIYPEAVRQPSSRYWTPVDVARRAAELLSQGGHARVLDVGAGVGKLCAIGALTTRATFTGVERRAHFVEVAQRTIDALRIPRALVVHGELDDVEWDRFDAYYLFNPFEENLYRSSEQLDRRVPLSPERFDRDVAFVEAALDRARVGTRVVTYHGFGGRIPLTYRQERSEKRGTSFLRLWVKVYAGSGLDDGHLEALMH